MVCLERALHLDDPDDVRTPTASSALGAIAEDLRIVHFHSDREKLKMWAWNR